jgi:tetratricopeptide (TPR) repeat protein
MYEFVAKLIIVLSIAGILTIIFRKLSEFKNMPAEDIQFLAQRVKKPGKISQKIKRINYHNIIRSVVIKLEKILKKLRVIALKSDNWFEQWIKILKNKEKEFKAKARFSKKQVKIQQVAEEQPELKKEEKKERFVVEEKKYIETIVKNPRDVKTYRSLGLLYLAQKNYKDAKESFRQILKINSKDKEAKKKLEEIGKDKPM